MRKTCVLCNSVDLKHIFTLNQYPITPSSTTLEYSADEYNDCVFVGCETCDCVQLQNLIDPIQLYINSHNDTDHTPTWKEHHRLFTEFIGNNFNSNSILEIGGSSGLLYSFTKANAIKYTILDICDNSKRPRDIEYIQGNCEEFDFTGFNCVVLSHTFEHLYSPRKFIECLSKSNVNSIFISIPNMDHLVESNNISVLHNEHTYYIGHADIVNLFSEFNYSCNATYSFRTHSLFYHFVYSSETQLQCLSRTNRINRIHEIFSKYEQTMKLISIATPCFICPAGHYGQKIYYYLKRFESLIKGFIDNDATKQGLRVYGTPHSVYSPQILSEYGEISIILYAGPYSSEIQKQLNMLNSSITYILL